jgi:glutamate/aspartate transport system substrate-binding protein
MAKSGHTAAFVMDEVLLLSLIAHSKDPKAYEIFGSSLRTEPYAIMMRKGDTMLKTLVNETLVRLIRSGEAEKIYARWFLNPIPPYDINLNLPMSLALKEAFTRPTDKGVE